MSEEDKPTTAEAEEPKEEEEPAKEEESTAQFEPVVSYFILYRMDKARRRQVTKRQMDMLTVLAFFIFSNGLLLVFVLGLA